MAKVFLIQGSNQGNKASYLKSSSGYISKKLGRIDALSDFYESEPWKMENAPVFWNQLIVLTTCLSPLMLLKNIKQIEFSCGRKQEHFDGNYRNRTIDIDVLFYDQMIFQSPSLVIPHPFLHLRRFVLKPLYDNFPNHIHPVLRKDMTTLLFDCSDFLKVKKIKQQF